VASTISSGRKPGVPSATLSKSAEISAVFKDRELGSMGWVSQCSILNKNSSSPLTLAAGLLDDSKAEFSPNMALPSMCTFIYSQGRV
jgi:hypothetical protein